MGEIPAGGATRRQVEYVMRRGGCGRRPLRLLDNPEIPFFVESRHSGRDRATYGRRPYFSKSRSDTFGNPQHGAITGAMVGGNPTRAVCIRNRSPLRRVRFPHENDVALMPASDEDRLEPRSSKRADKRRPIARLQMQGIHRRNHRLPAVEELAVVDFVVQVQVSAHSQGCAYRCEKSVQPHRMIEHVVADDQVEGLLERHLESIEVDER